jgi:arylsulfatase A
MADDAGIEAFGCYGGESYETPTLDRLAAEGVRFTNCHAQPLCTPSRVKIMTGRSNVRNYVRFGILDREERTFAHMLRAAGYRTAVAGKWQLHGSSPEDIARGRGARPEEAGFDEHCLWQIDRRESRYWNPLIERNGTELELGESDYGPDVFCRFILDFIDRHRERPFFVYYPMVLVHAPFVPGPDSDDRTSKDRQANFADMMAYADGIVDRIVTHLETLGLREDTLLLFTADNGTDRRISSRTSGGSVQGGKSLTLDTGTRVPLIASWPGTAVPRACDDLVDLSDVVPTLAAVAATRVPEAIDGRSFLPQIRGEPGSPRAWIYCYYNPRPGNARFPERRFARDHRWKLYGDGRLHDLTRDPLEKTPLATEDAGSAAAAARERLRAVIESFPSTGVKIDDSSDP